MGTRQIRYCDLSGAEDGVELHEVQIDQMRIEIDLAPKEYDKLLKLLQPYLDAPLSGSKATVETVENQYRATYDEGEANRLIGVLQKQANTDQVVLPISQSDELVYARAGVQIADNSYGPGWQLGLFGVNYV